MAVFALLIAGGTPAHGQGPNQLPPGQYQYFGPAGNNPPRRFTVTTDGAVHWQDSESAQTSQSDDKVSIAAAEEYKYPLIKWKGKRLMGTAKGIGWLTTTYEYNALKYQLTLQFESGLMKSSESVVKALQKSGLTIELLDENNFKITELMIPGSVFHATSKESVVEGRGAIPMPEQLYQRTRNITMR